MKKIMLFTLLLVFSLCAFSATPDTKPKSDNPAAPGKVEYRMSDEEINKLTKRGEVIPGLESSQQTIIIQDGQGKGRRNKNDQGAVNRDKQRHRRAVIIGGSAALLLFFMILIIV
jgi:hypothetical protein